MQITLESHELNVYTLVVSERVDSSQSPKFKAMLKQLSQEGKKNFIVDLGNVSFIDSTGLGVLTSLLRAARAMDGDVRLVLQPDSLIRNTLSLVRFNEVFAIDESPDDARQHFRL